MATWGYNRENGPDKWASIAPACRGLHQSPINIDTGKVERCHLPSLHYHYLPEESTCILNNGHTVMVKIEGDGGYLRGGPLRYNFQPIQFHFHWGRNNHTGSEHHVDGHSFAGELHIVHWNTELYASFEEAAKCTNGLAVLGAFLKHGKPHKELEKLTCHFGNISHKEESVDLTGGFNPAALLPANHGYWTYSGSLTTPPCYESARFLLMKEPIHVSDEQLHAFRKLKSHHKDATLPKDEFGGKILQNYRPIHPLFDRKVLSCG